MKYNLFLFIRENTFQFLEHKWNTDGTLSENWVMWQSTSLASLQIMKNWGVAGTPVGHADIQTWSG